MKRVTLNGYDDFVKFIQLCCNEKHYLGYTVGNAANVEELFGIRFTRPDGTIPDYDDDFDERDFDDDWEIDSSRFIVTEPANAPASYPVLVLFEITDEFDRFGKVIVRALDYVYPSDFANSRTVEQLTEDYCYFGYDRN